MNHKKELLRSLSVDLSALRVWGSPSTEVAGAGGVWAP